MHYWRVLITFYFLCVFGCAFAMVFGAYRSWEGRLVLEHNWEYSSKKTNNEMSHNTGAVEARREKKGSL